MQKKDAVITIQWYLSGSEFMLVAAGTLDLAAAARMQWRWDQAGEGDG